MVVIDWDKYFAKQNTKQAERIKDLEEAVGLLNSMILAGEKHSKKSEKVVKQALKGGK